MMTNFMNKMFGKIQPGMCRLSMNGDIAIKTSNGYKSYNVKTGRLTNQDNFVFSNFGEDFFFLIPTSKVKIGDIIVVPDNNSPSKVSPRCVKEVETDKITVMNYENSTLETIVPERHVFMKNTYYYGKIVSMFGDNFTDGGDKKKGANNIFKYMMMCEMFKGASDSTGLNMASNNNFASMMPMMMLMNNGGFDDMFNFDFLSGMGIDEDKDDEDNNVDDEEDE